MYRILALLLLVSVVLIGCAAEPTATPEPTPQPTDIPTEVPTLEPEPTATDIPTVAPTDLPPDGDPNACHGRRKIDFECARTTDHARNAFGCFEKG